MRETAGLQSTFQSVTLLTWKDRRWRVWGQRGKWKRTITETDGTHGKDLKEKQDGTLNEMGMGEGGREVCSCPFSNYSYSADSNQ